MPTVYDVAKYILEKQGQITTFKLQKLVYYSKAWSLVWDDDILFKNKIYAWANGPVCKDLYLKHKGCFEIAVSELTEGDSANLEAKHKATIDLVIKSYAHLSGQQLSNWSHTEKPWLDARQGLNVDERGEVEITPDSMVEYYSAIYAEQLSKKQ
jgi:uncharacterized phage-associated protein